MSVRKQLNPLIAKGTLNPQAGRRLVGQRNLKVRVLPQEFLDDLFILLSQQRAGCIHQSPSRLHQRGTSLQDMYLLFGDLGHRLFGDTPLHPRISPNRPEPGTRCIDEHDIKVRCE